MTTIGDNDTTGIMLFSDSGNALEAVEWPEARARIAALLAGERTAVAGWAENRAEDVLCTLFTGKASA